MAYEPIWASNERLNGEELRKLEKDGLDILKDIPKFAEEGFDSIPKEDWSLLKWAGLYLQIPKEAGYFMMRVKIPSGIMTNDQARVLAEISRDYGRNVFDVTTRQAIQFHWLRIENIPDIFRRLEEVGLTSVGACGDIPRNIVGNPLAGIDPDELVDTRQIVKEVHDFFHMNRDFSNLPRKFKISINSNVNNSSNAEINCIAFTPATKEIDGELVKGFHVKVGGGLSSKPYLAEPLNLFVRPEQVKDVAVAVTTIFRDYGYRQKRTRARLKFLMADWGPEKFTEKVLEYTGPLPEQGEDQLKDWNSGYFYGVHPQKQPGLSYIGLNIPVGRLDANEVLEIARIAKQYGSGDIRTCGTQNIILPDIPNELVDEVLSHDIFKRVSVNPPMFTGYSVSCTGIEYCNLALVETKERMRRIAEFLDREVEIDTPIRIHMVGCPNACGQRDIADIGLQGIKTRTKDKQMVDAFAIYVGGTLLNGGEFNKKLKGKIPAEDLPNVLKEIVLFYKAEKLEGEDFNDFVHRVGIEAIQEKLDELLNQAA